jgi:hypothetical protein
MYLEMSTVGIGCELNEAFGEAHPIKNKANTINRFMISF